MASIDWKAVPNSSNIAAVAHDGSDLLVRFKGGGEYRYHGGEAHHVEAILKAPSAGKYFAAHIKPAHAEPHQYSKLERAKS